MYVRWKKRPYSDRQVYDKPPPKGYLLSAVLVESRRVNGKPRQRHIAYLGSVDVWLGDPLPTWLKNESVKMMSLGAGRDGKVHPLHADYFWQAATNMLGMLSGQIDPDTRAVIEAAISAVIPQLDPLAIKYLRQERKAHDDKILKEIAASREEHIYDMANGLFYGMSGIAKVLLNLPQESTEAQVRAVYRRLAGLTHPDHGGDRQLFELVSRTCRAALGKKVVDTPFHDQEIGGALHLDRPAAVE